MRTPGTRKDPSTMRGVQSGMQDQTVSVPAEQPQPDQPRRKAKSPVNRDECPNGWDQEVWSLALEFRQAAQKDDIELRAGMPVIYAEIHGLVTRWKMREQTYPHRIKGCARYELHPARADHCWFHVRTNVVARNITMVEMVQVIMDEFWSRRWDGHALDYFRQFFADYGQRAVLHWRSIDIITTINDRPKREPAVMQHRASGASMPGTSKEGA